MKRIAKLVDFATWLGCATVAIWLPVISIPAAMLAASAPQGEPFIPAWVIMATVFGAALALGAGFAMFALGWRSARMDSRAYRRATMLLLLVPLATGVALALANRMQLPITGFAVALVVFTTWLQVLCVKRAAPQPARGTD